jgi:hypothetical protein
MPRRRASPWEATLSAPPRAAAMLGDTIQHTACVLEGVPATDGALLPWYAIPGTALIARSC